MPPIQTPRSPLDFAVAGLTAMAATTALVLWGASLLGWAWRLFRWACECIR